MGLAHLALMGEPLLSIDYNRKLLPVSHKHGEDPGQGSEMLLMRIFFRR